MGFGRGLRGRSLHGRPLRGWGNGSGRHTSNGGFIIPGWLLRADNIPADLDLDFANDRAWNSGLTTLDSLLSVNRNSAKWARTSSGLAVPFASGVLARTDQGALIEEQRTALAKKSRRLDDSSQWTASNVTTSAVQGADGVSASATRITATAGNATIVGSSNTSASAARRLSPFVRRVTGSGNLEWTLDGGSTWTAFTGITSSFTRLDVGATVANPRVGFRIVSSGDEFDIDFANGETGAFSTSPIESDASSLTRAADRVTMTSTVFDCSSMTVFAEGVLDAKTTGVRVALYELQKPTRSDGAIFIARNNVSDRPEFSVTSAGFTGEFVQLGLGGPFTSGSYRTAFGIQTNNTAMSVNGGSVFSDNVGTLPTGFSLLKIGQRENDVYFNSYVKRFAFWRTRVSNASLEALAT